MDLQPEYLSSEEVAWILAPKFSCVWCHWASCLTDLPWALLLKVVFELAGQVGLCHFRWFLLPLLAGRSRKANIKVPTPLAIFFCAFHSLPIDTSTVLNRLALVFTPFSNVFSLGNVSTNLNSRITLLGLKSQLYHVLVVWSGTICLKAKCLSPCQMPI